MPSDSDLMLLEKAQALIEVEKALTETLEKVEPWLLQQRSEHNVNPHEPRVRPIPFTMEQAETVLQVARTLASRTSAPAGWNPAAPVIGFTTPSPLPHQLRGGALATLQLELAKQAESDKKKQKIQQQEEQKLASQKQEEKQTRTEQGKHRQQPRAKVPQQQQPSRPKQEVSMNLSESSSEEEEEEDESDDDMEED